MGRIGSEKYAIQPEVLSYLQFVADEHDLRRDVQSSTRVELAVWDEASSQWELATSRGEIS
ncbi:MAG: hypothetical protein GY773_28780, partial [Actinomycetia bacterium]|nr:hypothetical protein [Actinomycetes bacterium]